MPGFDFGALIGGGLSGAASVIGTNLTNEANAKNVASSNAFNASEAEKSRSYQTEMSNTAYQRSMADMSKAGLNPMLAYMKGGASTPSGGQASSVGPARVEDALGKGVSSALDGARLSSELEIIKSEADKASSTAKIAKNAATISDSELPTLQKHAAIDYKFANGDALAKRAKTLTGMVSTALGAAHDVAKPYAEKYSPFPHTEERALTNAKQRGIAVPYRRKH